MSHAVAAYGRRSCRHGDAVRSGIQCRTRGCARGVRARTERGRCGGRGAEGGCARTLSASCCMRGMGAGGFRAADARVKVDTSPVTAADFGVQARALHGAVFVRLAAAPDTGRLVHGMRAAAACGAWGTQALVVLSLRRALASESFRMLAEEESVRSPARAFPLCLSRGRPRFYCIDLSRLDLV